MRRPATHHPERGAAGHEAEAHWASGVGRRLAPARPYADTYVRRAVHRAGAFGDPSCVHHRFLGRQALKIIRSGEEGADEALAEARVLVALNHPDIVRVFDADVAEIDGVEYPFFTMEYVEAGTLARLLQGRIRLSPTEPSCDCWRAAVGVAVAHALEPPVLHRDVTPGGGSSLSRIKRRRL